MKLVIFLVALFMPAIVFAAGNEADPPAISLTQRECLDLRSAIAALDGHYATDAAGNVVMAVDARGNQHPVQVPYKFAPGVVDKLATDTVTLNKVYADVEAAAQARLHTEAPGQTTVDPVSEVGVRLQQEYAEAMKKPCPEAAKLERISRADLKIDLNQIPPSVDAGLMPILIGK